MSDAIIVALIAVFGGGGVWQYIRASEANRILAEQSTKTIEAKDREINALRLSNEKITAERDSLMEVLTRPDTSI